MTTITFPESEEDHVLLFGLVPMQVEPLYDFSLPICVQGRLYEEEGWQTGGVVSGHVYMLTCFRWEGRQCIRHPEHYGRVFPGEASRQKYCLDHGLLKVYERH